MSGEFQVMGEVVAGVGRTHGRDGVAQGDALVQRSEGAEAQTLAKCRLANHEHEGEGAGGVHARH